MENAVSGRFKRYMEKMRLFIGARNCLYGQLSFLLAINIFSSLVLSGYFLANGSLYWDNQMIYSVFRDNLQSLNYFGEIQWWHPNVQEGFPSYYLTILGDTFTTPLFILTGFTFWALGLLGVHFPTYHPIFVVYSGFLVPLLFSLGFLFLARQIFTDNRTILFMLLMASFSPGVIFNVSDRGFEHTAYGLFFIAAYLQFLKRPGRRAFYAMCLTGFFLAASLSHLFLYWNILFIPIFIIIYNYFGSGSFFSKTREAFRSIPRRHLFVAFIFLLVCVSTAVITFSHGGDILRARTNTRIYTYDMLASGNPLEFLSISVPGIGFEWYGHHPERTFMPYIRLGNMHLGYTYMGLLSLPLAFVGLLGGRRLWRKRLFFLIAVVATVIILSGYSPLFSAILIWPTPLRAVSHYSDAVFRQGGFVLLMLAAGLGFELVSRNNAWWRKALCVLFAVSTVFSLLFFAAVLAMNALFLMKKHAFSPSLFVFPAVNMGLMLMLFFLYIVVLFWLLRAKSGSRKARVLFYLMALVLIDVSTNAFFHVRNTVWDNSRSFAEHSISSIGLGEDERSYHSRELLKLRCFKMMEDSGLDASLLPKLALYPDTSGLTDATAGEKAAVHRPANIRNLNFISIPPDGTLGSVKILRQSYNNMRIEVASREKAILFWRDAYSPYWSATVNNKPVNVERASQCFKAVPVPAGGSTVDFRFSPGPVPYTLALSYAVIILYSVLWLLSPSNDASNPKNHNRHE